VPPVLSLYLPPPPPPPTLFPSTTPFRSPPSTTGRTSPPSSLNSMKRSFVREACARVSARGGGPRVQPPDRRVSSSARSPACGLHPGTKGQRANAVRDRRGAAATGRNVDLHRERRAAVVRRAPRNDLRAPASDRAALQHALQIRPERPDQGHPGRRRGDARDFRRQAPVPDQAP